MRIIVDGCAESPYLYGFCVTVAYHSTPLIKPGCRQTVVNKRGADGDHVGCVEGLGVGTVARTPTHGLDCFCGSVATHAPCYDSMVVD